MRVEEVLGLTEGVELVHGKLRRSHVVHDERVFQPAGTRPFVPAKEPNNNNSVNVRDGADLMTCGSGCWSSVTGSVAPRARSTPVRVSCTSIHFLYSLCSSSCCDNPAGCQRHMLV